MYIGNHIVNEEHLLKIISEMEEIQGHGRTIVEEWESGNLYRNTVNLVDKYRYLTHISSTYGGIPSWTKPIREIVDLNGVIDKIAEGITQQVIPNFKAYDIKVSNRYKEELNEITSFTTMIEGYISAIGVGGVNISEPATMAKIVDIRMKHLPKLNVLKEHYMATASEEIRRKMEELKAEGKEMSNEEIEAIMKKYLNNVLTEEEYGSFYLGIMLQKPIKKTYTKEQMDEMYEQYVASTQYALSREEYEKMMQNTWTTFADQYLVDNPIPGATADNLFEYIYNGDFGTTTIIWGKGTVDVEVSGQLSGELESGKFENIMDFLKINFEMNMSMLNVSYKPNTDLPNAIISNVEVDILYGEAGISGSIGPGGARLKAGAIAGIAKGSIKTIDIDVGPVTVNGELEIMVGAVGGEIEVSAGSQGTEIHAGGAGGIGGITTTIEVRPVGANFKEINWSSEV